MKTTTTKQNNLLYQFTLLKFWEVQSPPPPTIVQASDMITNMINWSKSVRYDQSLASDYKELIVKQVQEFFPDWNGDSLKNRYMGKRKRNNNNASDPTPEPEQPESEPEQPEAPEQPENSSEPVQDTKPDPEPEPEPLPEPKKTAKKLHADPTVDSLQNRINAGIRNFYLVGPAGTGKTTICKELGKLLDMPVTILSCNSGTSPAEITGFKYPEPRPSVISQAIGIRGIVVFDEITMLDASVAAAANALLANNEIYTSTGLVVRDLDCIIIATGNTIGDGANRVYIGNNQLDASTLDRFVGGFIEVDYNKNYEFDNFDKEVVFYVHALRQIIANNGFRRIASTRVIQACDKLKKAGLDWKSTAIAQWSDEEKSVIPAMNYGDSKMICKDTDSMISFRFFSLADFYQSVEKMIGQSSLSEQELIDCKKGNISFYGATYQQIQERKFCWPEGVKKLAELSEMEKNIVKDFVKKWSDEDGDDMDVERFYNSMPFLHKRVKVIGNRSRGNQIQKIILNITENANIGSDSMLWKTFVTAKIVDELESRGVRCEVVVFESAHSVTKDNKKTFMEIPVKQADEPLNLSLLCTVLSPWFFRFWIFQVLANIKNVWDCYGTAKCLTCDDISDFDKCIVIDSGCCLSKHQANNFLKGVKI